MTVILDGAKTAQKIRASIAKKVTELGIEPGLSTILVGDDPASRMYIQMKAKVCRQVGFRSDMHNLSANVQESELLELIKQLNADDKVDGILVQLPLPARMDIVKVLEAIDPAKDVDGFHPQSMGELAAGKERLVAATPKGVIELLAEYEIPLEGKEVVIVNHSTVVGKPLAMLFLNRNATVTVCHVKTRDLAFHTRRADILVSATGVPHIITADMVKEGAIVVDVGITTKNGKTVGDVDFENVKDKCSYISPVPGGVGPMTIACLLSNTLVVASERN